MKYEEWKNRLPEEVAHWEWAVRDRIENMDFRIDNNSEIQDFIKPYISEESIILDIGSGVITSLGKNLNGCKLNIIAMDILADEYNSILDKHGIIPPVRTIRGDYESITEYFGSNSIDLVHTRNSLDHCNVPVHALQNMIKVCKPDGYVFIQVYENEANRCGHQGLHQWNFYFNSDKLIMESNKFKYIIGGNGLYLKREIDENGLVVLTILINKKESLLTTKCIAKEGL